MGKGTIGSVCCQDSDLIFVCSLCILVCILLPLFLHISAELITSSDEDSQVTDYRKQRNSQVDLRFLAQYFLLLPFFLPIFVRRVRHLEKTPVELVASFDESG
jgi:hypothetical protein